ncbi:hypothetical protein C1H46_005507 [Malus baccata]|uniref:Uncharacterized protein n=1 Tax=Malus baccata TaxID=106549 RepID=A0A540NE68_MALBA|nr:hypothetical protein C1H46_005507 [Malus baccata]
MKAGIVCIGVVLESMHSDPKEFPAISNQIGEGGQLLFINLLNLQQSSSPYSYLSKWFVKYNQEKRKNYFNGFQLFILDLIRNFHVIHLI